MRARQTILFVIGLALAGSVVVGRGFAAAAADVNSGLAINCETSNSNCQLDDFLNQFVVLSEYGLGLVGVLAVLMFVYGGFQYITAGGRASKVDEGSRVIQGTIIGIIISLTAYVIINFAVGAVTGTTSKGFSVFGKIASVFGGDKTLTKPFSGTPGSKAPTGCRNTWDTTCSDQAFCADPGAGNGPVGTLQNKLNDLGCNCGTADGCFGGQTVNCVRNFQIANGSSIGHLPTGIIDEVTRNRINDPASTACSSALGAQLIAGASPLLPATSVSSATGNIGTGSNGCCVVKNNEQVAYCAQQMNARACAALNGTFADGDKYCDQNVDADHQDAQLCGHCLDGKSGTCFERVGSYWCEKAVLVPQTPNFQPGSCQGAQGCNNTCYQYLRYPVGPALAP